MTSFISSTSTSSHISAVAEHERVFGFFEHLSLWFSLSVGLLVIQLGAYLFPAMGTHDALSSIVIGSCLGAACLAYVAHLGSKTGLSSAGLIQQAFGRSFARLPVSFNVIQLLGWAAFELVVMRDGLAAILKGSFGLDGHWLTVLCTLILGGLLAALSQLSMLRLARKVVSRVGLPLVLVSLLWFSAHFMTKIMQMPEGFSGFMAFQGDGSMPYALALDLVVAMPVSWLPLVADYARFSKRSKTSGAHSKSAFNGTWLGYAVANIWCYGLGFVVMATMPGDQDLINTLLLAQFGLIALTFILIDEMDNAYGDMYSGSVSLNHMVPKMNTHQWGLIFSFVATLAALVLPMHSLEPFLLILSSIFIPLFAVVGVYMCLEYPASHSTIRLINVPSVCLWVVGIMVYHISPMYFPNAGSTLPCLAVTVLLSACWFLFSKARVMVDA